MNLYANILGSKVIFSLCSLLRYYGIDCTKPVNVSSAQLEVTTVLLWFTSL